MSLDNAYVSEYTRNINYFLEAEGLTMHYPAKTDSLGRANSYIHAADNVSFKVPKGKTLGVVGESGCGKSTVGKMLMGILKPTSGKIIYEGNDITNLSPKGRKQYLKRMQLVWQDPYSSLDPRMQAGDIIAEGIDNFGLARNNNERREMIERLMEMCGLYPDLISNYPHQFSGGQRQRICIARALSTQPEFIVCDEAVSALDVSIQAQIINLLKDLQDNLKLTYLFISHDLNIVRFISDEIIVMYLGEVVERGTTEKIYKNPAHPYTKALFSATPAFTAAEKLKKQRIILPGDIPSPIDPAPGCRFRDRCQHAMERCGDNPEWTQVDENQLVYCHLYKE